jgi:hypothetical protein
MKMKLGNSVAFVAALFYSIFVFGGFLPETLVKTRAGYTPIEQLNVGDQVICCDFAHGFTEKPIIYKSMRRAVDCIGIVTNQEKIIISRDQKFCLPNESCWRKADQLNVGDTLFGLAGEKVVVEDIFDCGQPIDLYDITVSDCHNFLITSSDILVHNFVPFFVGFSWAMGAGIEFVGTSFGIGMLGGAAIGWKLKKNRQSKKYQYLKEPHPNGAQAPGKPTEADGFIPPKKGKKEKVKNPNGPGFGWQDARGNVWIPSGPKGHGGPHWDVQYPGGGYDNIVPGGKVRGKK